MMNRYFFFAVAIVAAGFTPQSFAKATGTYIIPAEESLSGVLAVLLKNLKEDTLVKGNGFTVEIPKGWTLRVSAADDENIMSLGAFPLATPDEKTATFELSKWKVAEDFAKIKSAQAKEGHKAEDFQLAGKPALRLPQIRAGEKDMDAFSIVVHGRHDFLAAGRSLSSDSASRAILEKMMNSLKVE